MLNLKGRAGEKVLLVCSEELTKDEKWKLIADGTLLIVGKGLNVVKHKCF